MLSQWVRDEVKQFDTLRKNGKKPNCVLSAYIYGEITEEDLYEFNTVFSTKDIATGENGFNKLLQRILAKTPIDASDASNSFDTAIPNNSNENINNLTAEDLSLVFLDSSLKKFNNFDNEQYKSFCYKLTKRIKCMSTDIISMNCENIVDDIYNNILRADDENIYRISGSTGTQKSFLMQMIYVSLKRNYTQHNYEPVYIHCRIIKDEIDSSGKSTEEIINNFFDNLKLDTTRTPLFMIDGLLNVAVDNYRLDYCLKNKLNCYSHRAMIISVTTVFSDNPTRLNRSGLIKGKYLYNLNLSRVSLYDKQKCLDYIETFNEYKDEDIANLYKALDKSGLVFIDKHILDIFCNNETNHNDIMDLFEEYLLDILNGDEAQLALDASKIYDFAYGNNEIEFNQSVKKLLNLICSEAVYLDCLIAIHYFNELEKYSETGNYDFFQMVLPKEITRFITTRLKKLPKYENIILSLGEHYNEMKSLGKSELSFFLGRIANANYRVKAIELLNKYYIETKEDIQQRIIGRKYYGQPYTRTDNKQDLFLLRGLSVSLIYCGNKSVLVEYIHSLIDDDLSNSINRGFHLEYYGDKRYLPNQDMLDYEDNPRLGERTLRILCNSVEKHLQNPQPPLSLLLEIFTVISLLQVRIEADKTKLSFNIKQYLNRCKELIPLCLAKVQLDDNIIVSFFKMAEADFSQYLDSGNNNYSAGVELCNDYLKAKDIKRTGWVMQGIINPESITEHMYSCWFIALTLLPNDCPDIIGYDKQKILNMLLIHDLAETKLDDIPKYEKINYPDYDKKENETMLSIFLKGTYGAVDSMTPYLEAWDEWYLRNNENARIAKDIDTIQAIYQFLDYNEKYPEKFDENRRINWLKEIQCIQTKIGKDLLQKLIIDNKKFVTIRQHYIDYFTVQL